MSEIAARCAGSPSCHPLAAFQPSRRHVEAEVHHALGNVHVGRRDAVAELHRVVHFVHEQAAIGILEQIQRHHAAAARLGRARADVGELRRDRAVARRPAARGVGDPVRRRAIDRADRVRRPPGTRGCRGPASSRIPGCRRCCGDSCPAFPCARESPRRRRDRSPCSAGVPTNPRWASTPPDSRASRSLRARSPACRPPAPSAAARRPPPARWSSSACCRRCRRRARCSRSSRPGR